MIVDEYGKQFRQPLDWSLGDAGKRMVERAIDELLRPSKLEAFMLAGRVRAVAEECSRPGSLAPIEAVKIPWQSL